MTQRHCGVLPDNIYAQNVLNVTLGLLRNFFFSLELTFISSGRVLRILRVLRAFRSLRSVSALAGLSTVVQTIGQSIPGQWPVS